MSKRTKQILLGLIALLIVSLGVNCALMSRSSSLAKQNTERELQIGEKDSLIRDLTDSLNQSKGRENIAKEAAKSAKNTIGTQGELVKNLQAEVTKLRNDNQEMQQKLDAVTKTANVAKTNTTKSAPAKKKTKQTSAANKVSKK